jgi:uncharacterized membrane protein YphA (DoxX/SURF4 family)
MIAEKIKTQVTSKTGGNTNGNSKLKSKEHKLTNRLFNQTEFDKKIWLARERAENTVQLGFEKAVAHLENPSLYPLPTNNKSVERALYNILVLLPKTKRNKIVDKVNETLKASSSARAGKYKDIVNVNFKSAVPIVEQVKAMAAPDELIFTEAESREMIAELKRKAEKPKNTGYAASSKPIPQQAAPSSKVSFFVDNMTCLNPDDVLKDEINLAGFAIDSKGNNFELAPFFVGKFRKNETVLLNGNNKLFTLNINQGVDEVQTLTTGLFIVENDLISNQELVKKLAGLFSIIGLTGLAVAIGLFFTPATIAAIIVLIVAGIFNLFAHYFIPLMGDDISLAVNDTLTFTGTIDAGTTFNRTLTIGKGFDANSTFDGKYTAAARWVGEQ